MELDSGFTNSRAYLLDALESKQMKSEMIEALKQGGLRADDPRIKALESGDMRAYHQIGLDQAQQNPDYDAVTIAKHYARMGDKENTLRWLDRAWSTHNFMFPFVYPDPAFDIVRDEPRFMNLMRSTGLSQ
jgi:hypothetical protein